MEEFERPEKRRKLEGDKGNGVLPATAPRSPRVLLNKININEGVLERLRKIKKLARESLLTTSGCGTSSGFGRGKPADKNEVAKGAGGSNTEATRVKEGTEASFSRKSNDNGLGLDSATTRKDLSEGTIDQDVIKIFSSVNSNESKEETIEVLDTSERWMEKSALKERTEKRKRDENSNESVKNVCVVKIAKLYDESVPKATQSASFSVAGMTRIVEGTVEEGHNTDGSAADRVPNKEWSRPMGVQNKTELSTASNQDIQKKYLSSNSRNRDQMNELNTQIKDETSRGDTQGKEVEVAKVAQDYAKSGAQPEKTKELQSQSTETTSRSHADEKSSSENNDGLKHTTPLMTDEVQVYQLLKDVIEKRTKHFEDNLLQENAKLENRVEHLERENALLQRTSKRLHLALQQVFKNREKTRQPRTSRGVQVNMNLRLSRTSFHKTSTINIDIPEQTRPTSTPPSVSQEKSRTQQVVEISHPSTSSRSPSSPSNNETPRSKNETTKESMSLAVPTKTSTTDNGVPKNQINQAPQHNTRGVDSSKTSPNGTDSSTVEKDPKLHQTECEPREVSMASIGVQAQENSPPKKAKEGMGHFKLDTRHKHLTSEQHNTSTDSGETGHFKITPYGLQPQSRFSSSKTQSFVTSTQESVLSQDSSRSPKPSRTDNGSQERGSTNVIDSGEALNSSRSSGNISEKVQTSRIIGTGVSNTSSPHRATTKVVDSGSTQTRTNSSPRATEPTRTPQRASSQLSPKEASSNRGRHSAEETVTASKAKAPNRPPILSPSVTNSHDLRKKHPDQASSVIPKHPINPLTSSKQASSQRKTVDPDVIIVSPTDKSPTRSPTYLLTRVPERRTQPEPSIRSVPNNTRVESQTAEQPKRLYSSPSAGSLRREMPPHSDRNIVGNRAPNVTTYSSNQRSQSFQDIHSRDKGQSQPAHTTTVQSDQALRYPNKVMRVHDQSADTVVANRGQQVPQSPRYVSQEIRLVDQGQARGNVPAHRGPGYPPHLIPSQPQRIQEQIHPQRSFSYDVRGQTRHPHPSPQGLPQNMVPVHRSEVRMQRFPVAIHDVRTQQPPPHPMQQQQHIVIRQHHPQQNRPPVNQQQPAGIPPQYAQQRPPAPQQTNIPRQPHFQTPHHLQQVPRPVVVHSVPIRPDPNNPRSPEFAQVYTPRPQFRDPNVVTSQPPHLIPGNVPQRHQGPVVVYQPGTLEGVGVHPGVPAPARSFERYPSRPEHVRQVQNPPQVQQHHVSLAPPRTMEQARTMGPSHVDARTVAPPPYEMHRVSDRRSQVIPPQQVPTHTAPAGVPMTSPPKPSASIAVVENGIVLSWNISPEQNTDNIDSYELFACQDDSNSNMPPVLWKKIGVVKALPLPMACTLTQFSSGSRYQFAVRAVDSSERAGPFSDPCLITLKKP